MFKNKTILITGGTGLVGRQLTQLLLEQDAKITIVSLDKVNNKNDKIKYIYKDLRSFESCLEVCKNKEIVLFCAGGIRSEMSVKSLTEKGFKNISHIEGGFGSISNSSFK